MDVNEPQSNDALLASFEPWAGTVPAGYLPTFFGSMVAVHFYAHWLSREVIAACLTGPREVTTRRPTFGDGEAYFEQANIARSVVAAGDHYIMVELGGGNGPRAVDSVLALRRLRPQAKPFLVVVEALPVYLDWCRHHFRANGIDPEQHWIIPAVVSAEPIPPVFFLQPRGFGNQMGDQSVMDTLASAISDRASALAVLDRLCGSGACITDGKLVDGMARAPFEFGDPRTWSLDEIMKTAVQPISASKIGFVSAMTLPTILAPLPHVDFMDMDIQHAEIHVVPPNIDLLTEKVRLLSIGTHTKDIHARLLALFRSAGWTVISDIEPFGHHVQGNESFDNHDGVLTVQNSGRPASWISRLRSHFWRR